MKLDLSIILLALFNFLYLLNCANFTPELPTNATNFEIVLMKSSNLVKIKTIILNINLINFRLVFIIQFQQAIIKLEFIILLIIVYKIQFY